MRGSEYAKSIGELGLRGGGGGGVGGVVTLCPE